jgi:hypothetical protein
MGTILPGTRIGKVEYFESHNGIWTTNAVAIGTSAPEMTALAAKTVAARAAFVNQQEARTAAKTATNAFHAAVRDLADAGTDVIMKIKAKAAVDGETVYDLAGITPPAPPSPKPAPGQPYLFAATLDADGALHLAWKCVNPPGSVGTIYQVARKVGATGEMQIIGATGQRKFVDPAVPAGSAQITYRVQALRSTVAGLPGTFTVLLGVAGGAMTAQVVGAPKLAA